MSKEREKAEVASIAIMKRLGMEEVCVRKGNIMQDEVE